MDEAAVNNFCFMMMRIRYAKVGKLDYWDRWLFKFTNNTGIFNYDNYKAIVVIPGLTRDDNI